jgi:hypothetical protein
VSRFSWMESLPSGPGTRGPVFSSAGNAAKQSWEGTFQGSGVFDSKGCQLHGFAGGNTHQSITYDGATRFSFQWEDPFFLISGGSGASRDAIAVIL